MIDFDAHGNSKFDPVLIEIVGEYYEQGHTDKQVADILDVSVSTLKTWKKKYADFLTTIEGAKKKANDRVKHSLYKRAIGFEYEEERIFHFMGQITKDKVKRYVLPDPSAAALWLRFRDPGNWRETNAENLEEDPYPVIETNEN